MSTTQTDTVTVHIPTPLRAYTGGAASVAASGATVGEALQDLVAQHPSLKSHLYNDDDQLRSFVNVYVGDDDIRYLDREATALKPGTEVSIVPSIAGGCGCV